MRKSRAPERPARNPTLALRQRSVASAGQPSVQRQRRQMCLDLAWSRLGQCRAAAAAANQKGVVATRGALLRSSLAANEKLATQHKGAKLSFSPKRRRAQLAGSPKLRGATLIIQRATSQHCKCRASLASLSSRAFATAATFSIQVVRLVCVACSLAWIA